jgi:hypothetical protein
VQKAPGEKASKANYMWMEKLSVSAALWSPPDIDTPIKKTHCAASSQLHVSFLSTLSAHGSAFLHRPLHCVGPISPEIALRKQRFSLFLQHMELLNRAVKVVECKQINTSIFKFLLA